MVECETPRFARSRSRAPVASRGWLQVILGSPSPWPSCEHVYGKTRRWHPARLRSLVPLRACMSVTLSSLGRADRWCGASPLLRTGSRPDRARGPGSGSGPGRPPPVVVPGRCGPLARLWATTSSWRTSSASGCTSTATVWRSSVAALCRSTPASRQAGCSTARQPGEIPAGAGRVWYCIDEHRRIVWLTMVPAGHPKQTE